MAAGGECGRGGFDGNPHRFRTILDFRRGDLSVGRRVAIAIQMVIVVPSNLVSVKPRNGSLYVGF